MPIKQLKNAFLRMLRGAAVMSHGAADMSHSAADTATLTAFTSLTVFKKNRKYIHHFLGGGVRP